MYENEYDKKFDTALGLLDNVENDSPQEQKNRFFACIDLFKKIVYYDENFYIQSIIGSLQNLVEKYTLALELKDQNKNVEADKIWAQIEEQKKNMEAVLGEIFLKKLDKIVGIRLPGESEIRGYSFNEFWQEAKKQGWQKPDKF